MNIGRGSSLGRVSRYVAGWTALAAATGAIANPCPTAPATLSLNVTSPASLCTGPGGQVTVNLVMSCVPVPVSGYQAFLMFDPTALAYMSGTYMLPGPFGLPIIYPISANGGNIDLASGINVLTGQQPSMADAVLATLTFQAQSGQAVTRVRFRPHDPPTQFSTADGMPLVPRLIDSPSLALSGGTPTVCSCNAPDSDGDADIDRVDSGRLVQCLTGPGGTLASADCHCSDADIDGDVDLADWSRLQRMFTGP